MNKKYIMSFMLVMCCVSTLHLKAQTQLHISSSDSSLFQLKVNTEYFVDSLFSEVLIEYTSGNQINLEIVDSLGSTILETDLFVNSNVKSDYSFDPGSDTPSLMLLSQSTAVRSVAVLMEAMDMPADSELVLNQPRVFVVSSTFTSSAFPNRKEIEAIDSLTFEREKIKAIKQLMSVGKLTRNELISVLQKISFEDRRAELIIDYKSQISSLIDEESLEKLFKLEKYRKKVRLSLNM